MTVLNGQPVDAAVTNAAFISRLVDSSTIGKVDFNNTTDSTAPTNGSVHTAGGLGVEKRLNVGGATELAGKLTAGNIIALSQEVDALTTGADAQVAPTKAFLITTNASLTSIAMIAGPEEGRMVCVLNSTGSPITVKHNTGATVANRIHTGTGQDVQLQTGSALLFLYSTNDSRWHAVGGTGGGQIEFVQETPAGVVDGSNDTFTLAEIPISDDSVLVAVNGTVQDQGTHYTVSSQTITFLPGFEPETDSAVYAYYPKQSGVIIGGGSIEPAVEYRTISGPEGAAEALTLVNTPSNVALVKLDIIGQGAQEFGVDYTVTGSSLSWLGLGLSGVLSAGDKLRISYFY